MASTPSSVCVYDGWRNSRADAHGPEDQQHGQRPAHDAHAHRVDHGHLGVAGAASEEPAQRASGPERAGNEEIGGGPPPVDQAGLHCVVDDEPAEPAPPGAADVDRQIARRDGAVGGEPGEHVLQDQALVRTQRVALVRRRGGPDPSQFLEVVLGREDSQPPTSGQIDHRGPESGRRHRGVVGQHVDHRRCVGAQRAGDAVGLRTRRQEAVARADEGEPGSEDEEPAEPQPADRECRREDADHARRHGRHHDITVRLRRDRPASCSQRPLRRRVAPRSFAAGTGSRSRRRPARP